MKHNMKYSVLPRLLALVFALALLLALAVTPVAAAKGDFTEWVYDAAARTLTATFPDGDTEVYYRVEDTIQLRYDPAYAFEYRNTVSIDGHRYDIGLTSLCYQRRSKESHLQGREVHERCR
jgi:YD repeat-containing protein